MGCFCSIVGASIARPSVGSRTGVTDGQWPPLRGVLVLFAGVSPWGRSDYWRNKIINSQFFASIFPGNVQRGQAVVLVGKKW